MFRASRIGAGDRGDVMGSPNFANRTLYYGDNLAALRRMNSETVHLIATDPPFKKQRGFFSDAGGYDDRWTWQRDILGLDRKGNAVAENHDDWVDQIQDDWPGAWMVIAAARSTYGDDMGAFLCWLGVRLMELRRILRNDGSIYVHIDHTAHAWTKALMDTIFGRANFRNETVWRRTYAHNSARKWGPVHYTILFYTKTDDYVWNPIYQGYGKAYLDRYYRFSDSRGRYRLVTLTGAGVTKSGDSGLPWRGVDPSDSGRHWAVPVQALQGAYPGVKGGENYITNRILICGPCNSRKSDTKTLKGLQNDNRRERWMKDRKLAEEMQSLARMRAEWVRDNWDTEQCREFIAGLQ